MAEYRYTIPDDKTKLVVSAICANNNYMSYAREYAARIEKGEPVASIVEDIGPADNPAQWAKWRVGLWIRGQVQRHQRELANSGEVPIDHTIGT